MFVTAVRRAMRGLAVLAPVAAIILVPVQAASAAPAKVCAAVFLTATGQDLGPDSQGVLHTRATVSLAGVKVARTKAAFTPSGSPTGTTLSFSGPIVFTPLAATAPTLTASVRGTVNLGSGLFQATSTTVTGTGLLAGVSGSLIFRGKENLGTGAFTETITGTLCAPIRR